MYLYVSTGSSAPARLELKRRAGSFSDAPFEGQLHNVLVRLAGADDPVVRPCGSARVRGLHPLQLLDDVRVCFLDERAYSAEGFPAPVSEFGDSLRNELRWRLV